MKPLTSVARLFLYLVPFSAVIVYVGSLFPFIVGKGVFMRTAVELSLVFLVWAWAKGELSGEEIKKRLWNPLVCAVAVFGAIYLLSGFTGVNPAASFWSNFERGEGSLQILHYIGIFFLARILLTTGDAWRRMLINSTWAAGLMIAYGVAAGMGMAGFIGPSFCERFQGSLGNAAYVGTYLIFIMSYAGYLFFGEKHSVKKWWWVILAAIFFVFLLMNQTRGAFLGFGGGVVVGLGYIAWRHPIKKIKIIAGGLAIGCVVTGTLMITNHQSINLMPFCKDPEGKGSRILDFGVTGERGESFRTRLILWEQSLQAFKDRPLLGWGPENFSMAFEKHFDTYHTVWFDRAHNIFFDYLVFSGALGLASFIGIFLIFIWEFLKKIAPQEGRSEEIKNSKMHGKQKEEEGSNGVYIHAILIAVITAYLIQGLVLFDVLPIYINLFITLAFAGYQAGKYYE